MAEMKKFGLENERGFAFIAALLAMLLLVSLSVLIFALTTRDMRITVKLVGQKKAFSAAEAGMQWLLQNNDPAKAAQNTPPACKDDPKSFEASAADTSSCFSFAPLPSGQAVIRSESILVYGYSTDFVLVPSEMQIIGTNTRYMSRVSVNVGIGYGPVRQF